MKHSARPLVVQHARRRGPRPVEPPSAPLPEPVLTALAAIAGDLRHLPRGCIGDVAELLHWLRRMAGRVDGVGRMRVPGALPLPAPRPGSTSPRDLAEVVFGRAPTPSRLPEVRPIVGRRGHAVRVEVRRARDAGQLEMWI